MAEENTTSTDTTVTLEKDTTVANTTTTENTAATTALNTTATTETKAAPVDDWASMRAKLAGEDTKVLKRLERYGTLQEAIKAGVEAQNKIGSMSARPGKDASPEEIAAYRELNGIPESADKYEFNLPDGIVLGEADKPYVDAFTKVAHEENLTPAQVNKLAAAHLEMREKDIQARAIADHESHVNADAALKSPEVWGSEVQLNLNLINGMLDGAPQGVKEQLFGARMADGSPLGNHVPTLQWLATMARELNPMATVVPGSGANAQQAMESEISKLEGWMADGSSEYWKGPNSEKNQSRYRDLVEARARVTR
jgi:hypothetical protein